jgi:predicted PurR-regulated permease PerM
MYFKINRQLFFVTKRKEFTMKKLLSILAIFALAGSVMAATTTTTGTSSSRLETYVNSKLSPITAKETEINTKIEAKKQANEEKKAEQKAALQNVKNSTTSTINSAKSTLSTEKNYLKSLTNK